MWKFSEQEYLARVLAPAVATFAKEGRLPDFFERYDLPLDIENEAEIEEAINTIIDFWNRRRQHPRDKQLVAVLVEKKQQTEAHRVLLDRDARSALRDVVKAE